MSLIPLIRLQGGTGGGGAFADGLTSVNVFGNALLLPAGGCFFWRLGLQRFAHVATAPGVEGSLQGIAFPAKEVVAVPSTIIRDQQSSNSVVHGA